MSPYAEIFKLLTCNSKGEELGASFVFFYLFFKAFLAYEDRNTSFFLNILLGLTGRTGPQEDLPPAAQRRQNNGSTDLSQTAPAVTQI